MIGFGKPHKNILSISAFLISNLLFLPLWGADVVLPVDKKASLCEWQLIPYETLDGMKGKFAHIVQTEDGVKRIKIPLGAKGRYRIWIGTVAKRWGGYVIYAKLDRDEYPVRMAAEFKNDAVAPEVPMIGELEYGTFDLEENDSLVIRNATGSPGGVAYVRLERAQGEKTCSRAKDRFMLATNDSYWNYSDKEEFFGHADYFVNCAFSSGAGYSGTQSTVVDLSDASFKDCGAGDWRPRNASSALCNGGTTWEVYSTTYGASSTTDLALGRRNKGGSLDIGCYEFVASGLIIILR